MCVDPKRPKSVIQVENKELWQREPVIEGRRDNGSILVSQRV